MNTRPSRLREANCDRLLRRPRTMLALADVVHLFADEFAGLRRGRFARLLVLACPLERGLFRHVGHLQIVAGVAPTLTVRLHDLFR
jgi:hypothetical protein